MCSHILEGYLCGSLHCQHSDHIHKITNTFCIAPWKGDPLTFKNYTVVCTGLTKHTQTQLSQVKACRCRWWPSGKEHKTRALVFDQQSVGSSSSRDTWSLSQTLNHDCFMIEVLWVALRV